MKSRSRFLDRLIARSAWLLLKALFLTVRVDLRLTRPDATPTVPPPGPRRYCFSVWHDAILIALFFRSHYSLSALVSRHQDGTYLSDLLNLLGVRPVRGSASRGGAQATRQLLNLSDLHICITPDGPRGPRRQMKDGIIYIASRTGRPIVCSTMQATRAWRIPGGWSDIVLPKPFSRVVILTSQPIDIPRDLSREEIAACRDRIQDEMDRLNALGERIVRGDESLSHELSGPVDAGTAPDARHAA